MKAEVQKEKGMNANIYRAKRLEINLNQRRYDKVEIPNEDTLRFLGGVGLNAQLLLEKTDSDLDPLDPDNPLIFGAGPLVGAKFPTAARTTATALSPLTGIYGDSNAGGVFGVNMKKAGWDQLLISGKAEEPVYLLLGPDGDITIRDAQDLWGLDTHKTDTLLRDRHPKSTVACIGPAGENLVRYAAIMTNKTMNSFSRTGMGAVMGSKNLKAIVIAGNNPVQVYDPDALNRIAEQVLNQIKFHHLPQLFTKYGTIMFLNILLAKGLLYGENHRRKLEYQEASALDIGAYEDAVDSKPAGCFRCPMACNRRWRIKEGQYKGEAGHGYEVAFAMTLGLTLGHRSVGDVLHLVNLLNSQGMDVNEFCGTAGLAVDAYKNNFLSSSDTDGLELDWGRADIFETLIKQTGQRQGFGNVMAEGTKRAAGMIGLKAERYALHMKGMHWPAHSAPPFVLAFSNSTRGGDFLKGVPFLLLGEGNQDLCQALFGATRETMNIYSHGDKGRAVWWHENYKAVNDAMGSCFYLALNLLPHLGFMPEQLADVFRAVTGLPVEGEDIMAAGERIVQTQRAVNSIRGLNGRDDSFTRRPENDSWASGINLEAEGMKEEYYRYRGLSPRGLHTRNRLTELGLFEAIEILSSEGRLEAPIENPYQFSDIVRSPSPKNIRLRQKTRLIHFVRNRVFLRMLKGPAFYRAQLEKLWRRRGRKAKTIPYKQTV